MTGAMSTNTSKFGKIDDIFGLFHCENRITDVNNLDNTRKAHYIYNYLGRRISRAIGAAAPTKYVYSPFINSLVHKDAREKKIDMMVAEVDLLIKAGMHDIDGQ